MCESALNKLCTEEEKSRLQGIDYPELQLSSKLLCDLFQSAIKQNRPEWKQTQELKAKQKEQRKHAKISAAKKKAAALAEEAKATTPAKTMRRGSLNRTHSARFRGVLRSIIRKNYKER